MLYLRFVVGVALLLGAHSQTEKCSCGNRELDIPLNSVCQCCDLSTLLDDNNVETAINACADNTTVLRIDENPNLKNLPPGMLDRFSDLYNFYAKDSGLEGFPEDFFNSNTKLISLNLKDNNIGNRGLPANLLTSLVDIIQFKFDDNPLTEVPVGFYQYLTKLESWDHPTAAQCAVAAVSPTCEVIDSTCDDELFYNVYTPETPEPEYEHEAVVCEKKSAKLMCPKGEFIELTDAFFGRGEEDTTCYSTGTTCEAGLLLDLNIQAACNGRRKCKVKNNKKTRKVHGFLESCHPYLEVQYNCVSNVGLVQKKKQVRKARKQAKSTGEWDAFFDMLSPST